MKQQRQIFDLKDCPWCVRELIAQSIGGNHWKLSCIKCSFYVSVGIRTIEDYLKVDKSEKTKVK